MIKLKKEKKRNKMKKTLFKLIIILICSSPAYSNEVKCNTTFSKLKPECNFIGKGAKKLEAISEKNKTINQSLENVGIIKKNKKKMSLKELNEKYKPIKLGNNKKK